MRVQRQAEQWFGTEDRNPIEKQGAPDPVFDEMLGGKRIHRGTLNSGKAPQISDLVDPNHPLRQPDPSPEVYYCRNCGELADKHDAEGHCPPDTPLYYRR